MNSVVEPGAAPVRERIPVIDLGPYLAGEPGAADAVADAFVEACEDTGFFLLANHGVPQHLIDGTFAGAADFFALDDAAKLALKVGDYNVGYLPSGQQTVRTSTVNRNTRPNLNESFYITRERPADHPDILAGKPHVVPNQWPPQLPGFRPAMLAYAAAVEALGLKMVPIVARSLNLPDDYFDEAFRESAQTLRLIRYQPQPAYEDNSFGFAPHIDNNFLTFLAQSNLPGLEVLTREGAWVKPRAIPGTFVVNTGMVLTRLSNDRFVATPHRVVNLNRDYRYAIPYFFGPDFDYVIRPVETCVGPDNPPRHEPYTLREYRTKLARINFAHRQQPGDEY